MADNLLFYGDNLDVLRRHVADESVDLVYLDPPFKSDQNYNVLFAEPTGERSAAQIHAFEDTWEWTSEAAAALDDVIEAGGDVSRAMQAFKLYLGPSDMLAYLAMMAPRLVELRRVMNKTASIYLHCDPAASHYLKVLMDAVFNPESFRNEIVWQRSTPRGHAFTRYPSVHDNLLFYGKGSGGMWRTLYVPHRGEYVRSHYSRVEAETGRHYMLDNCLNPNPNRPNLTYEWHGVTRVWRWTRERMARLEQEGRLVYSRSGLPRYKRYLDEMPGTPVTDLWADIPPINSQAQERLGYPTQKPVALLERIIQASSDEGDVVLDPFCGCGTAIEAAQKLGRRWVGIDITHLAINLIRYRLEHAFGRQAPAYDVIGEPTDLAGARALAAQDRFQFQCWALGLCGARPSEPKKGADTGIDGRRNFHDERPGGRTKQMIFSVKSGHKEPADVRDLRGVLDREKADIGIFITLEEPTRLMRAEATSAGFYHSPWAKTRHPRLQILTIAELLEGRRPDLPAAAVDATFKRAPRVRPKKPHQLRIGDTEPGE